MQDGSIFNKATRNCDCLGLENNKKEAVFVDMMDSTEASLQQANRLECYYCCEHRLLFGTYPEDCLCPSASIHTTVCAINGGNSIKEELF